MTKRSPDKREQTRLKKVENENQRKRYLAADYVMRGKSLREAAKKVGRSTFFVMEWRDRLLDRKTVRKPVKGGLVTVVTYSWKKGYKDFLKTRKPGPEPGNCPKT